MTAIITTALSGAFTDLKAKTFMITRCKELNFDEAMFKFSTFYISNTPWNYKQAIYFFSSVGLVLALR